MLKLVLGVILANITYVIKIIKLKLNPFIGYR